MRHHPQLTGKIELGLDSDLLPETAYALAACRCPGMLGDRGGCAVLQHGPFTAPGSPPLFNTPTAILSPWFSLIKSAVLKYGDPSMYLKPRPFFLGLILGQFVTAGMWYGIDCLAGSSHNPVMIW